MFKFIKRYIDINMIKSSFAFAIIYCVLFNSAVFIYKLDYYQANITAAILELTKDFVYNTIVLFVCFLGLSVHRIVFILGSLFLFVTGALASYYLFFFSIAPTPSMMPSIFGTHTTELYELLSAKMIIWITFSILICFYSINHFNIQTTKIFLARMLSAICLLMVINNVITPKYSFMKTYFPMQYLHNSYMFFFRKNNDAYAKEDISNKYEFLDKSDNNVIGVLVIGESARYDHFGINGYKRDTTPHLSNTKNLISFEADACANNTHLSVPCMLSRYGKKDIDLVNTETSILSILTKLGFDTIWFGTQSITKYYRNQKGGSFYDEVNFHAIPGGSLVFMPNSHDSQMIPHFEQSIKSLGKKFLVLHMTGSHWNYSSRYPKEFEKFRPVADSSIKHDPSGCSKEELINSYDNSILYTDFFLHQVIENLKDKNSFLIYSADHGESLGEEGRLTHGHECQDPPKEQYRVPLMVWVSDKYKNKKAYKWSVLKAESEKKISHDYIFHTILDCLNIGSKIIDKSLSLCGNKKLLNG